MSNSVGVVVVLGGTGYVGSHIAREFSHRGFTAVCTTRDATRHPQCVRCDITDKASLHTALDYIERTFGTITCIVHAASPKIERVKPARSSSDSQKEHTAVAVLGTEHIIREAVAREIGHAVIITSSAAHSDPDSLSMGAYPAAKKAQESLVRELSHELGTNLSIHIIAPGFLPGGLNSDLPTAVQTAYATRPEGTLNSAQEVALLATAIVLDTDQYGISGSVDPVTGTLTPFS